jgi:hypothetical protein
MISPAFAVQYAADRGAARSPASEAIVTTEPFVFTSSGIAPRQARNAPVTFVRRTASQPSGVCSSTVPPCPMPALQTRRSRRPKASVAALTAAAMEFGSAVSATTASAPVSAATSSRGSRRRPVTQTP